jgi:hypothetical protein
LTCSAITIQDATPSKNVASELHINEMMRHPGVQTEHGAVRGRAQAGVSSFLGIPYAAPPFGANRMRPPQPVKPWTGERDATAYGPTAPKDGVRPAVPRGRHPG